MNTQVLKNVQPLLFFLSLITIFNCYNPKDKPSGNISSQPSKPQTILTIQMPEFGFKSAVVDQKGNLWFGSLTGGLYQIDGDSYTQYTEQQGLCNNEVQTIFVDIVGSIWIGTSNGLCRFNGTEFTHISLPFQDTSSIWLDDVYPIINPNAVHSIAQDLDGDYWIGTGGGGAYYYDGEKFSPYLRESGAKYADSLHHNWIPDIKVDHKGNIWFASMSYGGLQKFDGIIFTQFLKKDGLSDDMIRKILVTESDTLWFGFNGNRQSGLTFFDGKSFGNYSLADGLCFQGINALLEDSKNRLWFGGMEGICIFDGNQFHHFKEENFNFEGINFIVEDHDNNIWFGGRTGIWKYNGESFFVISK